MASGLQNLGRRIVGEWTAEATHPQMPGVLIRGSSTFEWLEGEQFLILRSHFDHPDVPDGISIIGDTNGLQMYYFDSRGVHRQYAMTVTDDAWTIAMNRHAPSGSFASSSDAPFSQRMTYTIDPGDQMMSGKGQLSHDDVTWTDDLEITYWRLQ